MVGACSRTFHVDVDDDKRSFLPFPCYSMVHTRWHAVDNMGGDTCIRTVRGTVKTFDETFETFIARFIL